MEFQITTDLSGLPKVIDFNFEAIKSELDVKLDYYRDLVVTEDGIKAAKSDRASLNALKKAIDDRRKDIKKQCLAPYDAFESKCKELTGMIDSASGSIDAQVKTFEEREKAEKKARIDAAYQEFVGDLSNILPFELFYNPKWLNKTSALPAVIEELAGMIESSKKDIQAIRDMHLANEAAALSVYSKTRELGAAMTENMRLQRLAREAAEKLPPAVPSMPEIRTVPGHAELSDDEERQVSEFIDRAIKRDTGNKTEDLRTITVIFYETTAAFRADMKALTERHNIRYGGVK